MGAMFRDSLSRLTRTDPFNPSTFRETFATPALEVLALKGKGRGSSREVGRLEILLGG